MKKLGFALGSGGSRGVAHIGFLQAMEESGIRPDFISGSSMGSVVGSCYAAGMSVKEMKEAVFDLKALDILDLSGNVLKNQAIFKSKKMRAKLGEYLGEKTFEELKIPFSCVAVDLITGDKVVFDGKHVVADCVQASSSIPGIFKPLKTEGKLLVDGGLRERLPIDEVRALGADVVVAVDVLGELRCAERPFNLFTVITRMVDIYDAGMTELKLKEQKPDFLLRPDMGDMSQYKIKNLERAFDAGYTVGKENAEKIKKSLES